MPDATSNRNILERAGDSVMSYLTDKDTSFLPGIVAGLAGAGAGAFYTDKKRGETATQRAMRTVRNAVLGGALGAVGGQSLDYGLGQVLSAIQGYTPEELKKLEELKRLGKDVPGLPSSIAGRATTAGLVGSLLKYRQAANRTKSLRQLLPVDGYLNSIELRPENKKTKTPAVAVTLENPNVQATKKTDWMTDGKYRRDADYFLKQLRTPTLTAGTGKNVVTRNTVEAVRDAILSRRGTEVTSTLNPSGRPNVTSALMDDFLIREGVGQGRNTWRRFLSWLDRNLAFNPHASSHSRLGRGLGRAQGLGAMGAAVFAPEIASAITNATLPDTRQVLMLNLPSVGEASAERTAPPIIDFLTRPRSLNPF